eukprot:4076242-Prymnesium_polylepis.1
MLRRRVGYVGKTWKDHSVEKALGGPHSTEWNRLIPGMGTSNLERKPTIPGMAARPRGGIPGIQGSVKTPQHAHKPHKRHIHAT